MSWRLHFIVRREHFFAPSQVLTWYLKMRLPFEVRPNRAAAYRCSSKMISLALLVVRYVVASHFGALGVILLGDYACMGIGVMLFHWQHVYEQGYVVKKSEEWNRFDAAFTGCS